MGLAAKLILALALFAGGFAGGIKWHVGIVAARELQEQQARETDARQQRQFNEREAGQHAASLATLNTQLGDALEQIARLSGRACLDPRTVRMLNATGVVNGPAAAGQPAGEAPPAAAGASDGTGLRYSTDRDVAGYIALCRTRYAEVSDQLNKILDIEDRRYPPAAASP